MQVLLHPSDQPVFRLSLRAAQCVLEVRLNDVPVFGDVTGAALSLDIPINEWLFQGPNEIQVLLSPLEEGGAYGDQAQIEVILQHKFSRDAVRNATEVGVLRWQRERGPVPGPMITEDSVPQEKTGAQDLHDEDAPLLALPGQAEELTWRVGEPQKLKNKSIRISTSLMLPPPWPGCPWKRGQLLPADSRTLFAVQGLLRAYHQRLQHGGHDDFLKLRRAALEAAYYLPPAEVDDALGFPPLLQRKDWRLEPLPEKGLKLELAGGGRLARLLDEGTGEGPLILVNEAAGVSAALDAWWMFDGEWKLIR